jgi:hypothetical protein
MPWLMMAGPFTAVVLTLSLPVFETMLAVINLRRVPVFSLKVLSNESICRRCFFFFFLLPFSALNVPGKLSNQA